MVDLSLFAVSSGEQGLQRDSLGWIDADLLVCRLYLRSMLMPEVVSQISALEDNKGKGKPKSWAVSQELFPCQLSPDTLSQAKEVSV